MSDDPKKIHTDGLVDKLAMQLNRDRVQRRCDRALEAMTSHELPPDGRDEEGCAVPATCMAIGCKGRAVIGGYCAGHAVGKDAHTTAVLDRQRREFETGKQRA